MRILLAADALTVHTRRWATQFRDDGHDVHIASFRAGVLDGVKVHHLRTSLIGKAAYIWHILTLRKLFKRLKPDIVNAHYITSFGFVCAAARLHPLVVTVWGSDLLLAPNQSRVLRFFCRYALRGSDAIVVVAEHMVAAIRELGINRGEVDVIPFGVDLRIFKRKEVGKSAGKPRVICTRNFKAIYDVATLLRALALAKQRGIELDTVLLGDGEQRRYLEDLCKDLRLGNSVQFVGQVGQKELAQWLARSDIFVTPAITDGNNISLTEAMACGAFPIASDIPANRQWLTHGRNGFLYPSGSAVDLAIALQKAADQPDLRERVRTENREIVRLRANWEDSVRRIYELFKTVVHV